MSTNLTNRDQFRSKGRVSASDNLSAETPATESNSAAFTVSTLFQIMTGCCVFFACLRFNPILAIALTIILTPAIIRTGVIADIHLKHQLQFNWKTRLWFFFSSIGVVLLIGATAGAVFAMTSMLFAILGMFFNAIVGSHNLSVDAAVVGASGGMILGMAAAILMISYVGIKTWLPNGLTSEIG